MTSTIECRISQSAKNRLLFGHQWIYANECITPVKELPVGGIVKVISEDSKWYDYAVSNPYSLIAMRRLLTNQFPTKEWLWKRLDWALLLRMNVIQDDVFRLVYSEGDYLSGLIIDKYEQHFIIQITSAGMENWLEWIVEWIQKNFLPKSIQMRNDLPHRKLEGLSLENRILHGIPVDVFEWEWNSIRVLTNLSTGQKTGSYLDQRFNQLEMEHVKPNAFVLDLFTNNGGFAVRAAKKGAKVVAIDSSKSSIELAKKTAKINGVENKIEFIVSDVFEFLREDNQKYDYIICDPPPFAKNRKDLRKAKIAYQKLNEKCIDRLNERGILYTFSCSHLLSKYDFNELLLKAVKGRDLLYCQSLHQPLDHPILLCHPETEYLKGMKLLKRGIR